MEDLDLTAQATLDCPMRLPNDADAPTVRAYLMALVREVWRRGEGFSGKRPFGNSSWESDVYYALGRVGLIRATFDADGELLDVDEDAGNVLILAAIDQLSEGGA